jgi:precorrin-2 dehydrogenase/sirohydrochlorin ferrochelatase
MSLYPVTLDINGMLCLVIGGGKVASRKVDGLLSCGAKIRIISPVLNSHLAERVRNGDVQWLEKDYEEGDLQGAALVFATTDHPEIQARIVAEAKASAILVNVADMPQACSFQVPATFRQGGLLLTAATGGCSPALAAQIKLEFEASYGPEYATLVAMMDSVRGDVVSSGGSQEEHKRIFKKLISTELLHCIRGEQWDILSTRLQDILPDGVDVAELLLAMQNHNREQIL